MGNQLQSVWEQTLYLPLIVLNLPSKFEEMVRGNLSRNGSGRGATLADGITTHYKPLASWPSQLGGEEITHVSLQRYGSLDVQAQSGQTPS